MRTRILAFIGGVASSDEAGEIVTGAFRAGLIFRAGPTFRARISSAPIWRSHSSSTPISAGRFCLAPTFRAATARTRIMRGPRCPTAR